MTMTRQQAASAFCLVLVGMLSGCGREAPPTDGAPLSMRRLSEQQYRQSVADIFGPDIRIIGRFEPDNRREGLLAVGAAWVSVTPAGFEQYDALARGIAAQVVDPAHRASTVPCTPQSSTAADEQCTARFIGKYGRQIFRRPLTREEVESRVRLAAEVTAALGDYYAGLEYALASLLASPNFLFRAETALPIAHDTTAHDTTRSLGAYSRASRLSYFLWNTTPDEELLAAAANGDLNDAAALEQQVDRMLASPRLNEGTRAFFSDLLRFDDIDELSKDPAIYPLFSVKLMHDAREQTLRVVTDHLVARNGDFRELFTTRRSFMTRTLGMLYGVPVTSRDGWEPYQFPADSPRAGLLVHASLAALHAHPGRSSPTLRGKFVRETFLCQNVPPPPANVDFTMDAADAQLMTARERLGRHNEDPVCAGCHKLTDPIGLGLEQLDGIGAFRTREGGAIIDVGGALDGVAFEGAAQLGRAMRDNPQVCACLVRNVYQYATGRRVVDGDQPYLEYLDRAFSRDDYRWITLLRTIATSEAFYAVASPDEVASEQTMTTAAMTPAGVSEEST